MRRFLKNLFRNIHTTSKATAAKPSTRRAKLQVEGLEDRTVPTVVNFTSPTLTIYDVEPGHTVTIELNNNTQIEVLDNGAAVKGYNPVNKELISTVDIELDGSDLVQVNDSNGMPFAYNTAIWIYGNGPGYGLGDYGANTLSLEGSREVSGAENYVERTATTEGVLSLDYCTFNMNDVISTVSDTIEITGLYTVETSDSETILESGFNAQQEELWGGYNQTPNVLNFSGKPSVDLQENCANARVLLDTTQPEATEQTFEVDMEYGFDTLYINATPAGLSAIVGVASSTGASMNVASNKSPVYISGNITQNTSPDILSTVNVASNQSPVYISGNMETVNVASDQSPVHISGNIETVNVATDQSPVYISGNSFTQVEIGQVIPHTDQCSTKGIDADIQINGAEGLLVDDNANILKSSDVTQKGDKIYGEGLFGNNAVYVGFSDVGHVNVLYLQLIKS